VKKGKDPDPEPDPDPKLIILDPGGSESGTLVRTLKEK